MPFWSDMGFMDANSPSMEQLIFFYDHTMIIICSIVVFLLFYMIDMGTSKYMNLFLMENQLIELVWTIVPMFLLVFIAIPSLRVLYLMEESFDPSVTIKIVGHQWYWYYEYDEFNISLVGRYSYDVSSGFSEECYRMLNTGFHLGVPLQTGVRLLVTSQDVIHSWTIPSLGIKSDCIPGRLNQMYFLANKPGIYYGECSELCGPAHAYMPITMKIMPLNLFYKWVKDLM